MEEKMHLLFDFINKTIWSIYGNNMIDIEINIINPFFVKYRYNLEYTRRVKRLSSIDLCILSGHSNYKILYEFVDKLISYTNAEEYWYHRNLKLLYTIPSKRQPEKERLGIFLAAYLVDRPHQDYVADEKYIDIDSILSKYELSDFFKRTNYNGYDMCQYTNVSAKIDDKLSLVLKLSPRDDLISNIRYPEIEDVIKTVISSKSYIKYWIAKNLYRVALSIYPFIKEKEKEIFTKTKKKAALNIIDLKINTANEISIQFQFATTIQSSDTVTTVASSSAYVNMLNSYINTQRASTESDISFDESVVDKYKEWLTFTSSDYIRIHSFGFDAIFKSKVEYFKGNNNDIEFNKICKRDKNGMMELTKYLLATKYEGKPISYVGLSKFKIDSIDFSKLSNELVVTFHIIPKFIKEIQSSEAFKNVHLLYEKESTTNVQSNVKKPVKKKKSSKKVTSKE